MSSTHPSTNLVFGKCEFFYPVVTLLTWRTSSAAHGYFWQQQQQQQPMSGLLLLLLLRWLLWWYRWRHHGAATVIHLSIYCSDRSVDRRTFAPRSPPHGNNMDCRAAAVCWVTGLTDTTHHVVTQARSQAAFRYWRRLIATQRDDLAGTYYFKWLWDWN